MMGGRGRYPFIKVVKAFKALFYRLIYLYALITITVEQQAMKVTGSLPQRGYLSILLNICLLYTSDAADDIALV